MGHHLLLLECRRYTNLTDLTVCYGTSKRCKPDYYEEEINTSSQQNSSDVRSEAEMECGNVEHICAPRKLGNCSALPVDLVILKLKKTVKFNELTQPICLPENCQDAPPNATLYIAGWGVDIENISGIYDDYSDEEADNETESEAYEFEVSTSSMEIDDLNKSDEELDSDEEETGDNRTQSSGNFGLIPTIQDNLLETQVNYIPQEDCSKEAEVAIPSYMHCSNLEPAGGSQGDSGGPVMYEHNCQWTVDSIFVITVRDDFTEKVGPLLYVRVSHFIEVFIKPYMNLLSQQGAANFEAVCATEEALKQCADTFSQTQRENIQNSTEH